MISGRLLFANAMAIILGTQNKYFRYMLYDMIKGMLGLLVDWWEDRTPLPCN